MKQENPLFRAVEHSRECPRHDTGFIIGPLWDFTDQGKVLTMSCVNCGFRINSDCFVIEAQPDGEVKQIKQQVRRSRTDRIRLPLSMYVFKDVLVGGGKRK